MFKWLGFGILSHQSKQTWILPTHGSTRWWRHAGLKSTVLGAWLILYEQGVRCGCNSTQCRTDRTKHTSPRRHHHTERQSVSKTRSPGLTRINLEPVTKNSF